MKKIKNIVYTGRIIALFTILLCIVMSINSVNNINLMSQKIYDNMNNSSMHYDNEINFKIIHKVEMVANEMKASVLSRYNLSNLISETILNIQKIISEITPLTQNLSSVSEILNTNSIELEIKF